MWNGWVADEGGQLTEYVVRQPRISFAYLSDQATVSVRRLMQSYITHKLLSLAWDAHTDHV